MFKKLISAMLAVAIVFAMAGAVPVGADTGDFVIEDGVLIAYNGAGGAVVIPNTVTEIGIDAFWNNLTITSVIIPDSVTVIGAWAFGSCANLTSVTIGSSVTQIWWGAFYDCKSLTSITLPDSVTNVSPLAFSLCESLTEINVGAGNPNYTSIGGVLFNKDVTRLVQYPNGKSNQTYIIPNTVTIIEERAFAYSKNLTGVTIPNSVTEIEWLAFAYTGLKSVTLPDSVEWIGSGAFSYCASLTAINVSAGNDYYTSVNGVLFNKDVDWLVQYPAGKSNQTYIIPGSVFGIGEESFAGSENLTSVIIPNGVTYIGWGAFERCANLLNITIPDSVTSISNGAFWSTAWFRNQPDGGVVYAGKFAYAWKGDMPEDTALTLKQGTRGIAGNAFSWQENLTSVTLPDSVTDIGGGAFFACENLTSVALGKGVTYIGWSAFARTGIESITIPAGVEFIGGYAFADCENLTSVTFKATTPPNFDYVVFTDSESFTTIYVPTGSKAAYEAVTDWDDNLIFEGIEIIELDFCPDCTEYPCICVKVTDSFAPGQVWATTTLTPGDEITLADNNTATISSLDDLTLKVEKKTPLAGEISAFFAALLQFLK